MRRSPDRPAEDRAAPRPRLPLRALAAAAATAALAAALPSGAEAATTDSGASAAMQPVLGAPVNKLRVIGTVGDQIWGYGRLKGVPALAGDQNVPAKPAGARVEPYALVVYRPGRGWQVVDEARASDGSPLAGFVPTAATSDENVGDGDMDAFGNGALLGTAPGVDANGDPTTDTVLLVRNPGGPFRAVPSADAPTGRALLSGGGDALAAVVPQGRAALTGAEALSVDANNGAPARQFVMAVREPSGVAGALVGVLSRSTAANTVENAIFHWDGTAWQRETITLAANSPLRRGGMRIMALGGTGLDDAWLLARASTTAGGGVVLFRRIAGVWQRVSLGTSPFAVSAPAGTGVTEISPLGPPADSLTVTDRGVWVDGTLAHGGVRYGFTIYLDKATSTVTGSWCDAPVPSVCVNRLGAWLNSGGKGTIVAGRAETPGKGYRSFAWSDGGPFGQRVITNGLAVGGSESRGARLTLSGSTFTRVRGLVRGGDDAAFTAPDEGWLLSPTQTAGSPLVHVTAAPDQPQLQRWPVPARRPLLAVTGEPGTEPGDPQSQAIAVGVDGTVARYVPGDGWRPEFLLNGEGVRQRPTLRGVAWPEANRAHAIGDDGAMWVWRSATGLWEPDAAKPLDFFANLTSIAFDPREPARGFAAGRQGTLLRYGKTWTQEVLPDAVKDFDISSVTFAGSRAYAVYRDPSDAYASGVLVNDGTTWRIDDDAARVLSTITDTELYAIHGLPDGGVVAGGGGIVMKREGPAAPWRLTTTPPTDLSVINIRAIRVDGQLRAVAATYPRPGNGQWPSGEIIPPTLPGESPQLLPAIRLPLGGSLIREGANGQWLDEQHNALPLSTSVGDDLPSDVDEVYALELNDAGTQGWLVGGRVNRDDDETNTPIENARRRSAAAFRYPADPNVLPTLNRTGVPVATRRARFAFGGQASCRRACADSAKLGIAADVGLTAAIDAAAQLRDQPYGPRAFVYSGPRLESGELTQPEADRFADVAGSAAKAGQFPFFAARGADASATDAASTAYGDAFAPFPAPFGTGASPIGITESTPKPRVATNGARNHYAFDSTGLGGAVRVIVIDNSAGSLAASDPFNVPADASQKDWLIAQLDDARRQKIPAIVIGDRDANAFAPQGSNTADDAQEFAALLIQHGASAYLHNAPGINRQAMIPAGASKQIPQFGNGTLGRASAPPSSSTVPYYGEAGYLMVEVDTDGTDPVTNIAPVTARLIPVLDEIAMDPTDGTLLRRGKVTRWSALGRRPRMGDIDPYQVFPPTNCRAVACPGRVEPEYTFTSSRPDIVDFVQQDPRSLDDRAIKVDAASKPIADATSGLLCAYNGGTADVTITTGGLSYTQAVTVQSGAVQPPCGTRPLQDPPRAPGTNIEAPAIEPTDPGQTPQADPITNLPISVPPPPAPPAPNPPAPNPPAPQPLPVAAAFIPAPIIATLSVPSTIVPPSIARPLPPPGMTGMSSPVVEEKREEEEATESSQAYAAARPLGEARTYGVGVLVIVTLLAAGVTGIGAGSRRRPRPRVARARVTPQRPPRDPSPRRRRW